MKDARCERHALACGPDGRCVLCRRGPEVQAEGPRFGRWVVFGVVVAAAMVGYRALRTRSERALIAADAPPSMQEPAATEPRELEAQAAIERDPPRRDTLLEREFPHAAAAATGDPPAEKLNAPSAPATPPAEPPLEATKAPRDSPAAPADPPTGDVHVIVYTTSWCPHCRHAKAWMASHGVDYEERDIESSTENARQVRALNPRGSIPTFDIEGIVMVGFSEQGLIANMRRAATIRASRSL